MKTSTKTSTSNNQLIAQILQKDPGYMLSEHNLIQKMVVKQKSVKINLDLIKEASEQITMPPKEQLEKHLDLMRKCSKQQENYIRQFLPNSCSYDLYEEIDTLIPDLNIRNLTLTEILEKAKEFEKNEIFNKTHKETVLYKALFKDQKQIDKQLQKIKIDKQLQKIRKDELEILNKFNFDKTFKKEQVKNEIILLKNQIVQNKLQDENEYNFKIHQKMNTDQQEDYNFNTVIPISPANGFIDNYFSAITNYETEHRKSYETEHRKSYETEHHKSFDFGAIQNMMTMDNTPQVSPLIQNGPMKRIKFNDEPFICNNLFDEDHFIY